MIFDDDNFPSALPSRTQRKQDAHQLKKIGEELVNLPAGKFEKLVLPDDLRSAIVEARKITSRPARNRQLNIVGRILQDIDISTLRANLRDIDHLPKASESPEQKALSATLDHLIDRLLAGGDEQVFALTDRYSRDSLHTLRQVVRQAQRKLLSTGDRLIAGKMILECLTQLPSTQSSNLE